MQVFQFPGFSEENLRQRSEWAAMVGAGEGASDGSTSASASASDVLSSSSLPRSFSYGTDDGLEAGRRDSREALLGPGSRMNSRDSLLGSRQSSGM